MIHSNYLNKDFDTKDALFDYLSANKDIIVANKKSQVMKSFEKGIGVHFFNLKQSNLPDEFKSEFDYDKNYYLVVNMAGVLDSHEDLHVDGIWNKTSKDRQGKNYLVLDHELKVQSTAVKKEYIKMLVKNLPYTAIGKSYKGRGDALIYEFDKTKVINPLAKEWLESGDDIQASVRMMYVDVEFAYDSNKAEYKKEKENYDKYINTIANKDEFEEIPYFTIVKQADNRYESSLVLYGSNSSTGILNTKDMTENEPLKNTQTEIKTESAVSIDTVRQALKETLTKTN